MSNIAIRVQKLSKQYRIGQYQEYRTLRETLTDALISPIRRTLRLLRGESSGASELTETIWALEDVSFDIEHGEVVGIIGRNGAGKSTLLKILSRITEPTHGCVDIYGRVGSLLEVGTGFHPELTGRENIFLNGAILGMKNAEIQHKLDEIVAFAEVAKFLDTPIKHYSSGMYLRLAFAVAAHLEPEILMIDEVLAVGDAAFQKKCLGKIEEVAHRGRTVLFVSHNMGAIRSLCTRGIVLQEGRMVLFGPINECIRTYYQMLEISEEIRADGKSRYGFGLVTLDGGKGNTIRQQDGFSANTTLRTNENIGGFSLFCIIKDAQSRPIVSLREEISQETGSKGYFDIVVRFPTLWLNPGLYSLYFKAIFWGDCAQGRHESDKFPLDVDGNASKSESVINPPVNWSISSR